MKKLYILMPVHNNIEITKRFIKCLSAQTCKNYHLVLIDDGSTDNTADLVKRRIESASVISGRGDWWWGGSLHQGYLWLRKNAADPDSLVLIINNDTEFDPGFLGKGVEILEKNHEALVLARSYNRESRELVDSGVHIDWSPYEIRPAKNDEEVNCLSTRGLFLRVSDFFRIGGFYPRLLPHYWSDYEFTVRAFNMGMKLKTDENLKIFMDESVTGHREFEGMAFTAFIKKLFSRRSTLNPFDRVVFIMLACPSWKYKILNSISVIWMTLKMIIYQGIIKKLKS